MPTRHPHLGIQDYDREAGGLAKHLLFPRLVPPLSEHDLRKAIDKAFSRLRTDSSGNIREKVQPEKMVEESVEKALEHLKKWIDPIDGINRLLSGPVEDILIMDSLPAEIHRHDMAMGDFYHYLILELMHITSSRPGAAIEKVWPGPREGDIVADLRTPGDARGLHLFGSVKKNLQTVGGQDFADMIRRLENQSRDDQARHRPYICVYMVANPIAGRDSYENSRYIRGQRSDRRHSVNYEIWGPEFIFPYISGHSADRVFQMVRPLQAEEMPYSTIRYQKQASELFVTKLKELGLVGNDGKLSATALLGYSKSPNRRRRTSS